MEITLNYMILILQMNKIGQQTAHSRKSAVTKTLRPSYAHHKND